MWVSRKDAAESLRLITELTTQLDASTKLLATQRETMQAITAEMQAQTGLINKQAAQLRNQEITIRRYQEGVYG
jgi:flagellar capping protein FliD